MLVSVFVGLYFRHNLLKPKLLLLWKLQTTSFCALHHEADQACMKLDVTPKAYVSFPKSYPKWQSTVERTNALESVSHRFHVHLHDGGMVEYSLAGSDEK